MSRPADPDRPPRVRPRIGLRGLSVAAAASIGLWLAVEFVWLPRAAGYADAIRVATTTMERAHGALLLEKARRGLQPDVAHDPNRTGMIGPEFSVITTTLGDLGSKRTTATPAFAAALVRQIADLGLEPGTSVVIVVSGSFVGGNVAAVAAVEALGLRPVLISSVGASMWGATDPEFTWLDIEESLVGEGLLATGSTAAVIGGTGGIGREMMPGAAAAIRTAADRTGIPLLEADSLSALLDRIAVRLEEALGPGQRPGLVINVGGAVVGLGDCTESYTVEPGLHREPVACTDGTPGIGLRFLAELVPLLQILNIRRLSAEWDFPFDPSPPL